MKRYDKYKKTNLPWIEEIPEHWEIKKLKALGYFTSSGIDKKIKDDEILIKIINYTDIYRNSNFELRKKEYMTVSTTAEKKKYHNLKIGDLIFTPSSETEDELGISAVVMENLENTSYSYHVLRFRFTDYIILNFKKYLCNNYCSRNYFSIESKGTIRKFLNRNKFKNCTVFVPPLEEQEAIASYLDKKCSEIDKIIELEEKKKEKIENLKQSIISNVVTKGLNPNVEMKETGIDWIGKIPKHWKLLRSKNVVSKIGDIDHRMPVSINNGIPYLMTKDLKDKISSINLNNVKKISNQDYIELSKKIKIQKEDILLARYATIGTVCFIDLDIEKILVSYSCVIIKPNINIIKGLFLFYYFKSNIFKKNISLYINTNTQSNIGIENLKNILIPVPPLEEQEEIANYLDKKMEQIDRYTELLDKKIEKLKSLKESLISEVVTGQIDIRDMEV